MARKKRSEWGDAAHGPLALMLCESLLHELVENGVITTAQALNIIDTVVDLVHEAETSQSSSSASKKAQSATVIIEAIRRSVAAKGR